MKIGGIVAIVIVSVVASLGAVRFLSPSPTAQVAQVTESSYDRMMRTGTLRCGYALYPKFVERDPNTGKFSGMYVDILEEMGKQLSVKIEWTEEVGIANAFDGINAHRYDMLCGPANQTPGRARVTEFTTPFIYMPYFLYVRSDDTRFDNNYAKIDDPNVRFAYLEGDFSQMIRAERFPQSQSVSLPNFSDTAQLLLQVATGKADVAMTEPSSAEPFFANNPGRLKRVEGDAVRMEMCGLSVAVGEHKLRSLLNTTINAMLESGTMSKIMSKHTTVDGEFFLPSKPWGEAVPVEKTQ